MFKYRLEQNVFHYFLSVFVTPYCILYLFLYFYQIIDIIPLIPLYIVLNKFSN